MMTSDSGNEVSYFIKVTQRSVVASVTRDLHLSPTGCCGEGRGVVGPQLINLEMRFLIIIFMIC